MSSSKVITTVIKSNSSKYLIRITNLGAGTYEYFDDRGIRHRAAMPSGEYEYDFHNSCFWFDNKDIQPHGLSNCTYTILKTTYERIETITETIISEVG